MGDATYSEPGSSAERASAALLHAAGLSKAYGGVTVLDCVDVEFRSGEIHALLGENGAGKSTLVKILAGVVTASGGEVRGPAHDAGDVAMVFQELSVVAQLSVLDNLALAARSGGLVVPYRKLRVRAREVLDTSGLVGVAFDRPVETLSLAQQQLLEIARGLIRDAKVLILDEPTATLSDVEIRRVHEVVRRMAEEGRSIVYITHRLGEVFQLADHVTIMRSGRVVAAGPTEAFQLSDVVSHMLGGNHIPQQKVSRARASTSGQAPIEVTGLSLRGRFDNVCFTGEHGRVLALFGQIGSGADDVVRALAGLCPPNAGQVNLHGSHLSLRSRAGTKRRGVAYVPADRATEGVFLNASVTTNITSSALKRVSDRSVLRRSKERAVAAEEAGKVRFDQKRLSEHTQAFSGGNQQKVAIARALAARPLLLLMSEPTRGVDIGARAEIYQSLRRMAEEGVLVVVYTSDIVEIRDLADDVMTLYRGRVVGNHVADGVSDAELITEILHGSAA